MDALLHQLPRIKPMNLNIILLSIVATLLKIVETYLFRDWEYLKWLFVLLCLDTILGMVYAWKTSSFSSFGFSKVIVKFVLYAAALIVVNVLKNFTISGDSIPVFAWLDYFILTAMLLREAISVFENIAKIEPRILPTWLIARLKTIEENIGTQATTKPDANHPTQ